MEESRRSFLKLGGLCALGLGALPVVDALGKTDLPKVDDRSQGPGRQALGHGCGYEKMLGERASRAAKTAFSPAM